MSLSDYIGAVLTGFNMACTLFLVAFAVQDFRSRK